MVGLVAGGIAEALLSLTTASTMDSISISSSASIVELLRSGEISTDTGVFWERSLDVLPCRIWSTAELSQ